MIGSRTKKVIKYVVPTILSNVCFMLFSVVDGIFVGRGIGANGLGAVNLILPFVLLVNTLFILINVGSVTIFAISIGKGDIKGANRIFRQSMVMLIIVSAALSAAGVFFTGPICKLLGTTETFYRLAFDYLFWYSIFIIPSGLSAGLQAFCRNDNDPGIVGIAVIVSTAINILGDWLLIFAIRMETKGVSIATGVSQIISLLIVLAHFIRKKGVLRFCRNKFDCKLSREIIIHGLPESFGQLALPVMTLCMNLVLVNMIGDIGVNAFSIISYVATFSLAIFFGSSEGLQPLLGQSYGSKNEKDLKFYFRTGLWINFIGSIVVTGFIILLSRPVCALFGVDTLTFEYTLKVIPFYSWGFIVMAFNVMISTYLYSTEKTVQAIALNILRSVIVNAAVILILPYLFGANIVWFTFGIYEIVVLIIAVVLLRQSEKRQ